MEPEILMKYYCDCAGLMGLAPAGKLTFEGIPRAMEYRVEWSAAPGRGEWQREGLGITEVLAAGCCVGRRAQGTKGTKGTKVGVLENDCRWGVQGSFVVKR